MRNLCGDPSRANQDIKPKCIRYLVNAQTILGRAEEKVSLITKHAATANIIFNQMENNALILWLGIWLGRVSA